MDLSSQNPIACAIPELLKDGLDSKPEICYFNEDYVAVFKDEKDIIFIQPDFQKLKMLNSISIIITAPSKNMILYLEHFFTKYSILEDPVAGPACTKLVPYWFQRTGKTEFYSKQNSTRGGELFCKYDERRIFLSGYAETFMKGEILLNISRYCVF